MSIGTDSQRNNIQLAGVLLWTLLPCLAIWFGLYRLHSAVWAYTLYHGLCIIPAIIVGRHLLRGSLRLPSVTEWFCLIVASIVFCAVAVIGYEIMGPMLLSDEKTIDLMKNIGWYKDLFWPIGIYAITINPLLEELFWRGVVLNELERLKTPFKHFPIVWSSIAYAVFHYSIFRLVLYPVFAEIGTFGLVIYGALMVLIYRKTGSLLTTAAAHGLLTDMAALALMIDLFRAHEP